MFKSFSASLAGGKLPASFRTDPGAPTPIRQAVRLMYAGAAVSVVSLILTVISSFSLKQNLIASNAQNLKDHKVTMGQISTFATASITYAIVIEIAAVALWIWMAKLNEAGRSWARITSTVFFAIWTFYAYSNVNSLKGGMFISVSLIVSLALLLALWGIGVATIALLWRPVSTAYFKARSQSSR